MSDAVKLGGTSDAGATRRKATSGAAGIGEGKPMAPAQAAASPSAEKERAPPPGGAPRSKSSQVSTSSGVGGRAAAGDIIRAQMNEQADQPKTASFGPKLPDGRSIFEFPPVFEEAFQRNTDFVKRVFSPATILEPLPLPLKTSISRTFSFFNPSRLMDPNATREAIGLGRK
eukprot:CAMPEP_0198211530 /NCGR_PEP_ID=MMETSP1445-20131203/24302_1 /TAXON_ID=36898 /ORGANISM="Pyramimonas sp., Strain CCMP2087" /LENGTH=171 /DNA_ID=CAMNT_0043885803 /DNA_START=96 /DNA_END=611 /DNA_ORIENTATION=+